MVNDKNEMDICGQFTYLWLWMTECQRWLEKTDAKRNATYSDFCKAKWLNMDAEMLNAKKWWYKDKNINKQKKVAEILYSD